MNKYGVENFLIELIEETDFPEEREVFWIEQKQSFKNGYNATIGGDGKPYLNYDLLIATYLETQSIAETARICKCDRNHLSDILKAKNINIKTNQEVNKTKYGNCISQFTKDNQYIQTFQTAKDAARAVCPQTSSLGGVTSHITDVCKGKRKTAYGYIWKYAPIV